MTVQANDRMQSAFLQQEPIKMLIGGQWVEAASGKAFEMIDPSTGQVLARVAEGDSEDINRAVTTARKAFESGPWPKMTPSQRGRLLWKVAELIEQHADELAQLETLDNGKSIKYSKGGDVPLTADHFRYFAGWATKIEGDTIYGLAAGVWTSDIKKAHKMVSLLKAGVIWVNTYNQFDAAAPFGGYKQSGYGREMGHAVLDAYTQVKTAWINLR